MIKKIVIINMCFLLKHRNNIHSATDSVENKQKDICNAFGLQEIDNSAETFDAKLTIEQIQGDIKYFDDEIKKKKNQIKECNDEIGVETTKNTEFKKKIQQMENTNDVKEKEKVKKGINQQIEGMKTSLKNKKAEMKEKKQKKQALEEQENRFVTNKTDEINRLQVKIEDLLNQTNTLTSEYNSININVINVSDKQKLKNIIKIPNDTKSIAQKFIYILIKMFNNNQLNYEKYEELEKELNCFSYNKDKESGKNSFTKYSYANTNVKYAKYCQQPETCEKFANMLKNNLQSHSHSFENKQIDINVVSDGKQFYVSPSNLLQSNIASGDNKNTIFIVINNKLENFIKKNKIYLTCQSSNNENGEREELHIKCTKEKEELAKKKKYYRDKFNTLNEEIKECQENIDRLEEKINTKELEIQYINTTNVAKSLLKKGKQNAYNKKFEEQISEKRKQIAQLEEQIKELENKRQASTNEMREYTNANMKYENLQKDIIYNTDRMNTLLGFNYNNSNNDFDVEDINTNINKEMFFNIISIVLLPLFSDGQLMNVHTALNGIMKNFDQDRASTVRQFCLILMSQDVAVITSPFHPEKQEVYRLLESITKATRTDKKTNIAKFFQHIILTSLIYFCTKNLFFQKTSNILESITKEIDKITNINESYDAKICKTIHMLFWGLHDEQTLTQIDQDNKIDFKKLEKTLEKKDNQNKKVFSSHTDGKKIGNYDTTLHNICKKIVNERILKDGINIDDIVTTVKNCCDTSDLQFFNESVEMALINGIITGTKMLQHGEKKYQYNLKLILKLKNMEQNSFFTNILNGMYTFSLITNYHSKLRELIEKAHKECEYENINPSRYQQYCRTSMKNASEKVCAFLPQQSNYLKIAQNDEIITHYAKANNCNNQAELIEDLFGVNEDEDEDNIPKTLKKKAKNFTNYYAHEIIRKLSLSTNETINFYNVGLIGAGSFFGFMVPLATKSLIFKNKNHNEAKLEQEDILTV